MKMKSSVYAVVLGACILGGVLGMNAQTFGPSHTTSCAAASTTSCVILADGGTANG